MRKLRRASPRGNYRRPGAEQSKVPATLPGEAIGNVLRPQLRKSRNDAIAAYAAEIAGTSQDLDSDLEATGIEHLIETGK